MVNYDSTYSNNSPNTVPQNNIGQSTFNLSKLNLLDRVALDEFNTYRNWGVFLIPHEPSPENQDYKMGGIKPLFSNIKAVGADTSYQRLNNAPLLDAPSIREEMNRLSDCSIKALVNAGDTMGRSIYNYSDFMYCKYLGKISNNYLVTLRRFAFPCGDHIDLTNPTDTNEKALQSHMPDIGRMVTWLGTPGNDMSNILKYKVLMPYEELTAEHQTSEDTSENGGMLGAFMNLANPAYSQKVLQGVAGKSAFSFLQNSVGSRSKKLSNFMNNMDNYNNSWQSKSDRSSLWGPSANVISKTHKRTDGTQGGLEFSQEISLTFDYELRSYDGVNGKAAFLDLLSNILAVTYVEGKFWGGCITQIGASASKAFTNLPIYKLGNKSPLDFHSATDAVMDTLTDIGKALNGGQEINDLGDAINAVSNLAKNTLGTLIGGAINKLGRPQKQVLNSLLSDAPVGLWHLTIGNPKRPILTMGNMILTGVEIEHYGPLGLDDFPTGLRVVISLKHAKPRDIAGIEQMYLRGDFRTYYPMSDSVFNIYTHSSRYKDPAPTYQSAIEDVLQTESTSDKVEAGQSPANTQEATNQDSMQDTNKMYLKYMGLTDTKLIALSAAEGAWGSHKNPPPPTAEEVQQQIRERQKEKNK